ncbi:hypothetical protein B0H10DRAFT_600092 [Mycena sp. CBHHK59/15]|nr:hypothetical protein B0H10DRAFT_600092 [Mycena sp. CBHHK59/15]
MSVPLMASTFTLCLCVLTERNVIQIIGGPEPPSSSLLTLPVHRVPRRTSHKYPESYDAETACFKPDFPSSLIFEGMGLLGYARRVAVCMHGFYTDLSCIGIQERRHRIQLIVNTNPFPRLAPLITEHD